MAAYYPRTSDELGQIYGVGKRKLEEYGPHFLPLIQAYCQENDIDKVVRPPMAGNAYRASPSGQGRTDYVWEQFQTGESISDIAAELGFSQTTILNHLKKAFEAGRPLNIDGLRTVSGLSPEEEQRVMDAFADCGIEYLKPVFDALNETVPYDQLRLWRLIYQASLTGE